MNKNISFLLLLASCLLFLFGCSKSQLTPNKASQVEEDVYKLAVAAPQFGPYQALGLSIIYGAELAVDEKNESGGIGGKKIKLIKVDDGGLSGEGTWRARSLVQEMVLGVIGHLNSDISIPASEVYARAMIAEISPGSTSPLFTERKAVRGYVFRTIGRDDEQGKLSANYVIKNRFKKIAVLYNNRGYGLSLASEFVKKLDAAKIPVLFYKMYKVEKKDFLNEVNELKIKAPDLVYFVGEYGDAARFLKELKNSGLNTKFLGSEGVFDEEFILNAKDASENALVISSPIVQDENFALNYKKRFSKELGSYSANSFDATNVLISAIEKIKEKNPDKIAHEVANIADFQGVLGKISFNKNGDLVNPGFSIYEVKGGMFVAVR